MEIDRWWDEQLDAVTENYPYQKEVINEVAYGMGLYSKLPLSELSVEYLQNEKVPMIHAVVALANGKKAKLFSAHPVPPTRYKNLPDNAGQSEVALAKIGKMVQASSYPSIVAGDFNDVVWAYTDALTHTGGLLHDVRTGRGFYNSFDAQKWYMRYPLDHVLVTDQFSLVALKRLPSIDSDHFPISIRLSL
jgi:endonuclease/exonuclease/phosphatase (EEP) superfamily protein YafD